MTSVQGTDMTKTIKYSAALALLLAGQAFAAVPGMINFQGRLLDANKLPRNGSFAMTFKVCDSPAGACNTPCAVGNPCLWTEDQTVPVTNGVFAVQLGSVTALGADVFALTPRYLDITVAGETLAPRERLAAGAFSLRASLADDLAATASSVTLRGALTASSATFTGIGVGAAQAQLAPNVIVSSEASAALGGGVRVSTNMYVVGFSSAAMYYGSGVNLTNVRPFVALSTAGAAITLTANTEKLVVFSTITTSLANSKVFAMGNVSLYTTTTASVVAARLRRSAAGGSCLTSSTLVYQFSAQHTNTAVPMTLSVLGLDNPATSGTYVYCIGVISISAADTVQSRNLAVIEADPSSIASKL